MREYKTCIDVCLFFDFTMILEARLKCEPNRIKMVHSWNLRDLFEQACVKYLL